jgi:Lrp/AsnC family leucine-responsive transcriptional regulator
VDTKDCQIIRALQKDGRLTNQDLAERVNLSPSPCLRRVRNLEAAGVITGYTALVDQKAYGLPITVFVRVRLNSPSQDLITGFEAQVQRIDQIQDCFLLAGSDDYLLRVIVDSLEGYEAFMRRKLHAIPGIASIDTSFAYGVVKQTRVFPIAN